MNKIDMKHIIAVTNRNLCDGDFLEQIERICRNKPRAIILREKDLSEEQYFNLAKAVNEICKKYDVPLILHTFIETAENLNIPKIHLPLRKLKEAKKEELNFFEEIGASTHSVEDALLAQKLGATYISAGHVYETDCKKGLAPRGLEFLKNVCKAVSIPVYGIGGINLSLEKIREVEQCGAAGSCVMSAMMKQDIDKM